MRASGFLLRWLNQNHFFVSHFAKQSARISQSISLHAFWTFWYLTPFKHYHFWCRVIWRGLIRKMGACPVPPIGGSCTVLLNACELHLEQTKVNKLLQWGSMDSQGWMNESGPIFLLGVYIQVLAKKISPLVLPNHQLSLHLSEISLDCLLTFS